MKIIDLLNKIARNEKISVNCRYFDIDFYDINNFHISYSNIVKDGLTLGDLIKILNDEVEILEEKKIPEKLEEYQMNYPDGALREDEAGIQIELAVKKINEIIDILEMLNAKIK